MAREPVVKRQSGFDARNLARLNPILGLNRIPKELTGWRKTVTINDSDEIDISCDSKNMVPHGSDADVMFALTTAFVLQGTPQDGTVRLSMMELCTLAGIKRGGKTYQTLKESIQRLRDASYTTMSWMSFEANGKFMSLDSYLNFSIIDSVRITNIVETDENEVKLRRPQQYTATTELEISLNRHVANSIRHEHTRYLDLEWYSKLSQPLHRLLYRTLEEMRSNSKKAEVILPVTTLGEHLGFRALAKEDNGVDSAEMPVEPSKPSRRSFENSQKNDINVPKTRILPPKQIRRALNSAHEALIKTGYLKSVIYVGTGPRQTIQYTFQDVADLTRPADVELVRLLMNRGVNITMATEYAVTFKREQIELAARRFDERVENGFRPQNRGGFMVHILKNPQKYEKTPDDTQRPTLKTKTTPASSRKAQEAPSDDAPLPRSQASANALLARALTSTTAQREIRQQLIAAYMGGQCELLDFLPITQAPDHTAERIAQDLLNRCTTSLTNN